MNHKTFLVFLIICSFFGALCSPMVKAYTWVDYNNAILKAADRLVTLQADITEDNAGNGDPDSDPEDGGWNWQILDTDTSYVGTGPSPVNLYGITALGVLEAFKINPKTSYMTTMVDVYSGALARSGVNYGPDVLFLVELSKITANTAYASLAKDRYDARLSAIGDYNGDGYTNGKDLGENRRDYRHGQGLDGAIPWDIHLYIEAALALHQYFPGQGYDQHAKDMADVIYNDMTGSPGYFDPTDNTQEYYILGLAGAIEAFVKTGTHLTGSPSAKSLKDTLLTYQEPTGEWRAPLYPTEDIDAIQHTAYVVMALMTYGGSAIFAARRGAEWLIMKQNLNGGWSGSDEYPEVDSEAAQALAASSPIPPVGGTWSQ